PVTRYLVLPPEMGSVCQRSCVQTVSALPQLFIPVKKLPSPGARRQLVPLLLVLLQQLVQVPQPALLIQSNLVTHCPESLPGTASHSKLCYRPTAYPEHQSSTRVRASNSTVRPLVVHRLSEQLLPAVPLNNS